MRACGALRVGVSVWVCAWATAGVCACAGVGVCVGAGVGGFGVGPCFGLLFSKIN